MIKIIAVLESEIGTGGGYDQALNAIIQMQRLSNNKFIFEVFYTQESNSDYLKILGIKAKKIKITIWDKALGRLSSNNFWHYLQARLNFIGQLEKKLTQNGCDLVYFVTPSRLCLSVQKLNYITTLWDLCHREHPEFPEVSNFNEYSMRENFIKSSLGLSLLTLTDSKKLADIASKYYGVDRKRFLAMPFTPSPFLEQAYAIDKEVALKKYNLEAGYFFYPAQFWAHKNHIRILQALIILRDETGWMPIVIFSGKDYGNRSYIEEFIQKHKLKSQVKILGFVPPGDMRALYQNSQAVIMPTYFGPTNLPPLEAWSLGIPLIYSEDLVEQAGEAALLVDPDSAVDLANAMSRSTDQEVRLRLISAAKIRLADIERERKNSEDHLLSVLVKFSIRRQCWK